MSTLTKVFVVLTSVLTIALSCLFISAAAQWDNWKSLAQQYSSERDAAATKAQAIAASSQIDLALKGEALAAAERDLGAARTEFKRMSDENSRLLSDLALAENGRLAAEAGRTKLQEMLDVESGERKAMQAQNQQLSTQTIDLQSRNARQNSRILELTTNVTILQDQLRNVQEKLFAAEQNVARLEKGGAVAGAGRDFQGAEGAVAVAPSVAGEIRGEIMNIDEVYATINVGESEGVVAGMTFMIYREGGAYLGDLIIERVQPGQAAGRLTTKVKDEIRKGDAVVYGLD